MSQKNQESKKNMLAISIGLAMELSALLFGAYFISVFLSSVQGWDENITIVVMFSIALIGWFYHAWFLMRESN